MKTTTMTILIFAVFALVLIWNSITYVPAGESVVQTAGVSSTSESYYDKHTHMVRKDGCEYVLFSGPEQGGIAHHGACDNPNCNFKR